MDGDSSQGWEKVISFQIGQKLPPRGFNMRETKDTNRGGK